MSLTYATVPNVAHSGLKPSVASTTVGDMKLNTIAEVEAFVKQAHAGQTDQLGRDYFEHHLRPIADKLIDHSREAEMAGLLHDVLEDTDVTAEQLRELGVPEIVVTAVESVTKRDDEPYEQLIERSAAHPLGCVVKLADNALNQIHDRAHRAPRGASRTRKRHLKRNTRTADPSQTAAVPNYSHAC